MLQAVLFDCDGVLADSELLWNDIDAATLAHYGIHDYKGEHKEHVMGVGFTQCMTFYRDHYGIDAALEALVETRTCVAQEFYAQRIPGFAEVTSTLTQLNADGFALALATSSVSRLIMPFLRRLDIEKQFQAIITGERVRHGKPAPDIYLLAADALGVPPAQCLVVEDAPAGLQAGRSAGAITVAIPDLRWNPRSLFEGKADYIVESLGDVPALARDLRAQG